MVGLASAKQLGVRLAIRLMASVTADSVDITVELPIRLLQSVDLEVEKPSGTLETASSVAESTASIRYSIAVCFRSVMMLD